MVTDARSGWDLVRKLVGVEPLDDSHARGETGPGRARNGLFGGQMIAQSLAACAHTVPSGAIPDSLHANLLSGGQIGEPVDYTVERVRDGRALQHREVRGYQGDELIVQCTVVSAIPLAGLDWQHATDPEMAPPHVSLTAPTSWFEGLGGSVFQNRAPPLPGPGTPASPPTLAAQLLRAPE